MSFADHDRASWTFVGDESELRLDTGESYVEEWEREVTECSRQR